MIVSIHQPAYLPWLGYLDRIARSDRFVFLDTVQFEKNSFTNRNRLHGPGGAFWLTVPVAQKGHTSSTLAETRIAGPANWARKHLSSIQHAYRRAPRFEECYPALEELYEPGFELLADLCWHQLRFWVQEFGIDTELVRASDLDVRSQKSQLVLDICELSNADHYISGPLGRDYLELEPFRAAGIHVEFHEFEHPEYPQHFANEATPFQSHLGAVDAWFQTEACGKLVGQ